MSFLTVSGTVVPIKDGGVEIEYTNVGDRARAWDGTLRQTVTGQRKAYRITTAPMSSGTAASVVTALSCTPPLAIAGDMLPLGVSAVYPELISAAFAQSGTGVRSVLEYRLHEGIIDTPLEWWRGGAGLYTSTAFTTQPTTEGTRLQGWTGRLNGYQAYQTDADAADQPIYALTAMGSTLPSVNFNARPWMYSTSSGLIAAVDGVDQAWSLISVVEITTGVNSERYWFTLRNSTNDNGLHGVGVTLVGADLVWHTLRRQDGTATAVTATSTVVATDGRNNIVTYRFDGTRVKMWANNTLVLNSSLDVATASFNDTIFGAIDRSGNFQWSGWAAEYVYFPGIAISQDTRVAFEGLFGAYST